MGIKSNYHEWQLFLQLEDRLFAHSSGLKLAVKEFGATFGPKQWGRPVFALLAERLGKSKEADALGDSLKGYCEACETFCMAVKHCFGIGSMFHLRHRNGLKKEIGELGLDLEKWPYMKEFMSDYGQYGESFVEVRTTMNLIGNYCEGCFFQNRNGTCARQEECIAGSRYQMAIVG
jgi:hypothetical protein